MQYIWIFVSPDLSPHKRTLSLASEYLINIVFELILRGGHISQKWYEFTTGDAEIDRYGRGVQLVIENVDRCDRDYRLVIENVNRYG